ncbi:histidine phosphatase family protein [Streptomyces sp. NPDC020379]|uniref:histidine phosphatase family protein n=1 Tax=Streptomyces sp. NPDC020379 TaxID=3365071 RepID=UPI0037B2D1E6
MTDFILVRHGETSWHAENRYAGRTDIALTARGREQAAALAGWSRTADLTEVWSSPLSRARFTAAPAAQACGLPHRVDERLRELDFGKAEGMTRAEMREAFPDRLDAFLTDPDAHHLPGGESPQHAADRASACLTDIAVTHPEGRILVVAHSTLLRLLLCRYLGLPLRAYRGTFPRLPNTALTGLRLTGAGASLLYLNVPLPARPEARDPDGRDRPLTTEKSHA